LLSVNPAAVTLPSAFVGYESAGELDAYLVETAIDRYEHLFGQPGWQGWWGCPTCRIDTLFSTTADSPSSSHSQTNMQVQGVDEGDLIETDGRSIFMISQNTLSRIDASNAVAPRVSWSRAWHNSQSLDSIYLHNGRLTVVSQSVGWNYPAIDTGQIAVDSL